MFSYKKIFWIWPVLLLINIFTLGMFNSIFKGYSGYTILNNDYIRYTMILILILLTLVWIFLSIKSLPFNERWNILSRRLLLKYIRHPLYASFLLVFNFAIVLYFNDYIFIIWVLLALVISKLLIIKEEDIMIDLFGSEYIEYKQNTWAFIPKIFK